ncbi:Cof-type HAD-IIB family hydrolase [Aeribacillus alveayuensis]|uniref:Cof subfamily protein (Haloacid dehalogenase superfamily) n=1 Tax=Aeribacillus alveayuensis TaxID=279215 RepID=A0ABT9VPU9_9BACI|nr:Cof subfamily protein (haloacid dehalogenase superfamily) [Bacillus alveayuensis]
MIYRLLALNIDGTLLRSNGRLQSSTKEAIEFVQKKDVYVTLVTNRHFQSAKKLAKALKIDNILITHSGAFVANRLDQPLFVKRIPEERTFNIVQVLENFPCNIRIVHERFSIGNRKKISSNLMSKMLLNTADPLFYPIQFVESLGDTLRDDPVATPKIDAFFEDRNELQHVQKVIQDAFPEVEVIQVNQEKLEIVSKGVSKASSLQLLGKHLGINLQEMVVIGNSLDDLEMIAQAGLGVAMGNSPIEVKRSADWITRSNDDQGVSYMVKEHFRKQHRIKFLERMKHD